MLRQTQGPPRVTGPIVVATFRTAIENHGPPASTLTDNGLVYTTRFARGGASGLNGLEKELQRRRIVQKNSRPNHPTTCGKICEDLGGCTGSGLTLVKV